MSDETNIRKLLTAHAFGELLEPEHVDTLTDLATPRDFQRGDFLTRMGKPATQCYLICRGQVTIELYQPGRGSRSVETLSPTDSVLGWSWLVTPYTWCFDSRAIEPTQTLALDTKGLRDACEENHEFGYQVLKRFTTVFAERLRATRLQLTDMYSMEQ
jgi:CRP/FNR family transcriptional regulator, cyclic AMP receptor protein